MALKADQTMAMATRDVEKENAVQNEASPRVAGPVSGGSGGRKRTTVGSSCREAKRQRAVSATALLEQPCREGILPPGEPTGQQQAAPGADPAPAPTAVAAAAEPLSAASPAQDDRLVHAKAKASLFFIRHCRNTPGTVLPACAFIPRLLPPASLPALQPAGLRSRIARPSSMRGNR